MILRNKKTGEIIEGKCFTDIVKKLHDRGDPICSGALLSIALFEQYWKEIDEYKTVEPLIKDEKIRKVVRAWADINSLEHFTVINEHFNCCKIMGRKNNRVSKIEFLTTIPNTTHRTYTIVELCGEEEE